MLVSIIIPALNEQACIAEAVAKGFATGAAEVIVVDGGSHDGTSELAVAEGAKVVLSKPGRGLQQNLGARNATGEVLLFLHADCWLEPAGMQQLLGAMADPTVQSGAFRQVIDAPGRLYRWLEQGNAWRAAQRGLPYGDQGLFFRRALFEQLGGFPEVALMEDLLLMQRVRRVTTPVLLDGPLHVSARRWQRQGVIRQTARNWMLLSAHQLGVSPDRLAKWY